MERNTEHHHYSDQPHHRARSEYWNEVRRYEPAAEILAKKSVTLLIRRQMRRVTKDGK